MIYCIVKQSSYKVLCIIKYSLGRKMCCVHMRGGDSEEEYLKEQTLS